MNVRRGDVVLVDYLFSDRTGSKVRPCLIVQNDQYNQRVDDTIAVAISSNTARAAILPSHFIVDVSTTEGKQSGLLFNSAVQCENLVTIDSQFIIRKIGILSTSMMTFADNGLKTALGIT